MWRPRNQLGGAEPAARWRIVLLSDPVLISLGPDFGAKAEAQHFIPVGGAINRRVFLDEGGNEIISVPSLTVTIELVPKLFPSRISISGGGSSFVSLMIRTLVSLL